MPETVRLVLNRNSEQPYVLHREDCPTIQHQVRCDLRQELRAGGSQILETYEDGLALIGPNEGTERWYFDAVYVTLEELATGAIPAVHHLRAGRTRWSVEGAGVSEESVDAHGIRPRPGIPRPRMPQA